MSFALQAGQLELNVMMPLMAHLALESTQLMINALKSIRELCINEIKANESQCAKYANQTSQIITVLSPIIGYPKAAEMIKSAEKNKKAILDLIKEQNILSEKQIQTLFNLRDMTEMK